MKLGALRTKLTRIERQQKKLTQQVQRMQLGAKKQLQALPAKIGLKTIDELIIELLPYASPRLRARIGAGPSSPAPKTRTVRGAQGGKTRKGYSAETKAEIRAALEKGDLTAAKVSEQYGVSLAGVNLWKKQWGLTKSRQKK